MVLDDAEKFEQKNITDTRVDALLSRILEADRQNYMVDTIIPNYSWFGENANCDLHDGLRRISDLVAHGTSVR